MPKKKYGFYVPAGSVRFARYFGKMKMYSHLHFPYGGLELGNSAGSFGGRWKQFLIPRVLFVFSKNSNKHMASLAMFLTPGDLNQGTIVDTL